MRFLATLIFIVFCVCTIYGRWYYVCQIKQLCEEQDADVRLKTLQLLEEGSIVLLDGYDEFAFSKDSIFPRFNDNNLDFLDSVVAYVKASPNSKLDIMGLYRPSEKDVRGKFLENLGLERANVIRKYLQEQGIDEDRMTLDHNLSFDSLLSAPLRFDLYTPDSSSYARLRFTFEDNTFSDANFKLDSDEFRPGASFVEYADSVKIYLEMNPKKRLTIIGHADYQGTEEYNMDLGLRRAKSAREYFKELGVNVAIKTETKGETEPVASNRTPEGRQKNRRVNFVID